MLPCPRVDVQERGPCRSLHFPLLRFVASMLIRVCKRREMNVARLFDCVRQHATGRNSIPSALVLGLSWAEVALQARVMICQIKAGMWSRNGSMLPMQVQLFGPHFAQIFDASKHDVLGCCVDLHRCQCVSFSDLDAIFVQVKNYENPPMCLSYADQDIKMLQVRRGEVR